MNMKLVPGKLDKDILSNRSREELESLILMLQGEVHDLRKQNLEKDMEIANLREINRMRLLEKYMPSSEQMASLFDELELYDLAQPVLEDEGRITVSAHEKTRKQTEISSMPASTPVYDVYHTEGADESYTDDGIEYRRIEDEIVSKIAYVPQRVVVERHHYPKYRAVCAVEEGKETEGASTLLQLLRPSSRMWLSPNMMIIFRSTGFPRSSGGAGYGYRGRRWPDG